MLVALALCTQAGFSSRCEDFDPLPAVRTDWHWWHFQRAVLFQGLAMAEGDAPASETKESELPGTVKRNGPMVPSNGHGGNLQVPGHIAASETESLTKGRPRSGSKDSVSVLRAGTYWEGG